MECKFFVGQKVVCVLTVRARPNARVPETVPVVGVTYTVRGVEADAEGVGLFLEEIVNPPAQYCDTYGECAFDHQFFRPTTDITIFNEILANAPKELEPV